MARPISATKVKAIKAALDARVHREPTQTAIAKRFGVCREAVSEISRGVYQLGGTKRAREKRAQRAEAKRMKPRPGYCPVCRCSCLIPCVACAGRLYARLKRERGSYVLPDGAEADLLPSLSEEQEARMVEVHV